MVCMLYKLIFTGEKKQFLTPVISLLRGVTAGYDVYIECYLELLELKCILDFLNKTLMQIMQCTKSVNM